jgi:hypothetical protein
MTKIAGSGSRIRIRIQDPDPNPGSGSESGSTSQRYGSADPDPDPPQNFMDFEHCLGPCEQEFLYFNSGIFFLSRTLPLPESQGLADFKNQASYFYFLGHLLLYGTQRMSKRYGTEYLNFKRNVLP